MSSRPSIFPASTSNHTTNPSNSISTSTSTSTSNRARQYSHLHAQLAQLNAHLSDTENLLRMTAAQAEYMRSLGGFCGGLFMASAKVLGEEAPAGAGMVEAAERDGGLRGEIERERERGIGE